MSGFADELKARTKQFGLRIVQLVQSLPEEPVSKTLGNQLLRCGTSVGANYRAACRARSPAEFRSKLGIVEEECDESVFWMEMLVDAELIPSSRLENLIQEANEILAIIVTSINTSRRNKT
ncbi:MAG: four helix bundle protein [Planctomycetes bacterium]|nr:four helix bundle protein [Planctomycetota bacterium]